MRAALRFSTVLIGLMAIATGPSVGLSQAATCRDPAGFPAWLAKIKQEALAQGISERAVDEGLDGVTFDQNVVRHDHGQGVFRQTFEQFSQRMVPPRLARAKSLEKRYAPVFSRIEQRYGVSPPVLLAIWGLETDFGAVSGNFATIRSIATLAFDCRRSDMFKAELFDALRMVQRGAASSASRGAWAGEIGQTQFMPSTYIKSAVNFDGAGAADLNHSVPDVLASTAHFLQQHGWQRGAGWAPGQPNFAAIQEWNKSSIYSRTIAYFATRLAGTDTSAYGGGSEEPAPRRATRTRRNDDLDTGQGGGVPAGDPLDEQ
jgi:membrane-bound lytic murein transglycosylase B